MSFSQVTNTEVVGELEVEIVDDVPVITASAINKTDVYYNLKHVLSFITHYPDKTTSKESFEDFFTLEPKQSLQLKKSSITIDTDNNMIVLLLIYDEDEKLIAKDRIVLKEVLESNKPNDGIKLLGIVADETKTKFGKDFYDFFYYYYNYYKIKGEKIIKIEEIVSFRRNTQIQVTIDGNVIFTFFSRPDNEFLEEMSKIALRRVVKYFERLEKENVYITQY